MGYYHDVESNDYDEDEAPKFLTQSSRNVWVSKDGRETKVIELDNFHLANIVNMLRRVARDRMLRKTYGTMEVGEVTAHMIHDYLREHCITYDALVVELKTRNIWNIHKIDLGVEHKLHDLEYSADDREKKLLSTIKELNVRVVNLENRINKTNKR